MYYPGGSNNNAPIQFYSPTLQGPEPSYYQTKSGVKVGACNQANSHYSGADHPNVQVQLVPQAASPNSEFWCRELNGDYTLRTMNTIMHDLQPGEWAKASSGYPYFIRHA